MPAPAVAGTTSADERLDERSSPRRDKPLLRPTDPCSDRGRHGEGTSAPDRKDVYSRPGVRVVRSPLYEGAPGALAAHLTSFTTNALSRVRLRADPSGAEDL